jgi:hypothetical protein
MLMGKRQEFRFGELIGKGRYSEIRSFPQKVVSDT